MLKNNLRSEERSAIEMRKNRKRRSISYCLLLKDFSVELIPSMLNKVNFYNYINYYSYLMISYQC